MHGPLTARALNLVAAGLRPEVAQIPRLRMAAPLVLANQVKRATHKFVQVRIDGVPITAEWSEINHPF